MPDVPSLNLAGKRRLVVGIASAVLATDTGRMLADGTSHVDGGYSNFG